MKKDDPTFARDSVLGYPPALSFCHESLLGLPKCLL